ncbi:MAG: hydrolase 1, exosortase A system-associated [Alteraurantiacibacter sp.]
MTRRHFTFPCEGDLLVGTLDEADAQTGLLIVSGGSEPRNGAFTGQARLAARIAARGFPVFRFDRRGVGDSSGIDTGFLNSQPDIAASLAQFRKECPTLKRIAAFGNCDAAAALMLGNGFGLDALALANPWTFDDENSQETPAQAIKARYWQKLRNPRELGRLLTGKVSVRGVARSIRRVMSGNSPTTKLGDSLAEGLSAFKGRSHVLLAARDRTAQAFRANYPIGDEAILVCDGADHAFSEPSYHSWLEDQIVSVMEKHV